MVHSNQEMNETTSALFQTKVWSMVFQKHGEKPEVTNFSSKRLMEFHIAQLLLKRSTLEKRFKDVIRTCIECGLSDHFAQVDQAFEAAKKCGGLNFDLWWDEEASLVL